MTKLLALLALFALMVMTSSTVLWPSTPAAAEHGDDNEKFFGNLPPIASVFDVDPRGVASLSPGADTEPIPAIVGNFIDRTQGPVPVCARDAALKDATEVAVGRWNTGLRPVVGRDVYVYDASCEAVAPGGGPVTRVEVSYTTSDSVCKPKTAAGCFIAKTIDKESYSFTGILEVRIDNYGMSLEHNFSLAGDWNPPERTPMAFPNEPDDERRAELRLQGVVTHELGHVFGFGHHINGFPPCDPPEVEAYKHAVMHSAPCGSPEVKDYDRMTWKYGYSPAKVGNLVAQDGSTTERVKLTWSSTPVHVERGFEVQVKVTHLSPIRAPGWVRVGEVAANKESLEFDLPQSTSHYTISRTPATTTQTGSKGTYRVVSLTDALANVHETSISNEAVHEIPKLPAGPIRYRLTTSAEGGGDIGPQTGDHDAGTIVPVKATWDTRTHRMTGWGGACSDETVSTTSPARATST